MRSSLAIGVAACVPAWLLAQRPLSRVLVAAAAIMLASALLRRAVSAESRRGYVFCRLCSLRYQLPAFALPLGSALVIARFGMLGAIAVVVLHVVIASHYRARWSRPRALRMGFVAALLGGYAAALETLALSGREWRHGGRLLYAEESPLQRIVLVERADSLELFIDGELQFRSADEQLYHDGLLGPALESLPERANVLVLGGGDGLAARDLLRSAKVERITIVDWDRALTRLFRADAQLRALNASALHDVRVRVLHRDVRLLLDETDERFDLIVGDLTDPNPSDAGSRELCSPRFYAALRACLKPGGALVTHASSLDDWAAQAVPEAMAAAGFRPTSYARVVPSFERVLYVLGER